jgi:hypothetical protein
MPPASHESGMGPLPFRLETFVMRSLLAILSIFTLMYVVAAQNESTTSPGLQSGAAPPAASSPLQTGSLIYAELSKSIDSKKAKVGDPVVAKVTQAVLSHGKIAIPKNAKIVGHLTAAKARTKDQPQAQLGIAFDRAELKDGSQIPLMSTTIQALASAYATDQTAPNLATGGAGGADASGMPNSHSGANMGGMTSPMGGSRYPTNTSPGGADTTPAAGSGMPASENPLNANSHGVTGMPGVRLESQPQGGVVSVEGKNLKLDSGTQMVLRTQ